MVAGHCRATKEICWGSRLVKCSCTAGSLVGDLGQRIAGCWDQSEIRVALGCTRLHLVALLHFTPTNRVKFDSCVFSSSMILIQWGDSSLLLRVSKIVGAKWAMDTTSSFLGFRVFLESPGEELKPQSPCHFKSKGPCRGWCATGSWQEIESGRVLDEDWCSSGCRHGELSWKPFASWRLIWQFDITHTLMYV